MALSVSSTKEKEAWVASITKSISAREHRPRTKPRRTRKKLQRVERASVGRVQWASGLADARVANKVPGNP